MGLLTELQPPNKKYPCKIRTLLETLESEDSQILQAAINDPTLWPAKTLQKSLNNLGLKLSDLTIQRHRSKSCSC